MCNLHWEAWVVVSATLVHFPFLCGWCSVQWATPRTITLCYMQALMRFDGVESILENRLLEFTHFYASHFRIATEQRRRAFYGTGILGLHGACSWTSQSLSLSATFWGETQPPLVLLEGCWVTDVSLGRELRMERPHPPRCQGWIPGYWSRECVHASGRCCCLTGHISIGWKCWVCQSGRCNNGATYFRITRSHLPYFPDFSSLWHRFQTFPCWVLS